MDKMNNKGESNNSNDKYKKQFNQQFKTNDKNIANVKTSTEKTLELKMSDIMNEKLKLEKQNQF